MGAETKKQCCAWVSDTWGRGHRCAVPAKHEVAGFRVCGIHKRVAERWQREQRLESMVGYWWKG
jgi:hypothetical protein